VITVLFWIEINHLIIINFEKLRIGIFEIVTRSVIHMFVHLL